MSDDDLYSCPCCRNWIGRPDYIVTDDGEWPICPQCGALTNVEDYPNDYVWLNLGHWYPPGYGLLATYSVRFCSDSFIWQDVTAFCMKQTMNRNPITDAINLEPVRHVVQRSQPGM